VRGQLREQRGGANVIFDEKGQRTGGARLLAVVTLTAEEQGRHYRLPTDRDYKVVWQSLSALHRLSKQQQADGFCTIPNESLPRTELRRMSVLIYGVERFCDMFTARQLLCLATLASKIRGEASASNQSVNRLLTLSLDKTVDLNNANTPWKHDAECPVNSLARHDIPMAWGFVEACILGDSSGSFSSSNDRTADSVAPSDCQASTTGNVQAADACSHSLPDASAAVWFTDPPYYDSVPYAHLSDFYYVWARRALAEPVHDRNRPLTPKAEECVVDRPHSLMPEAKTASHFEARIALAMKEGTRVTREDGIASVVFAHKTTEGWEALLGGMIDAGWVIKNSWPIATEMQARLNARENASLATSVHLVCRPRTGDEIGDWDKVYAELPKRVGEWMVRLEGEDVRGADLVFACIGPALEIYSRYVKVVDAEEREIPLGGDPEAKEPHLRGYLAYVWEAVGRAALQEVLGSAEAKARNGGAGALEEDARLTALFLWTLQSAPAAAATDDEDAEEDGAEADDEEEGSASGGRKKKGFTLVFDVVRRFAQPLGIHLPEWEGRILETKKGVVRLLPVSERARQLFGDAGAEAAAERMARPTGPVQQALFPEMDRPQAPPVRGRARRGARPAGAAPSLPSRREPTTLDRVHAAMLLQAGGKAHALRALLQDEQQRGPDFLRLANALSALYPRDSEEKRLLDAMLLAVPRR
jgi:putative DNA methylase